MVKFSHLKVFDCVSYAHINFDACSKRDAKSKICFFIGYGDEKFGYRFWDEQNRKIIRSRNVIFNEQVMYKDRLTVVSDVTEIDQKKSEFVNLDELTESSVHAFSYTILLWCLRNGILHPNSLCSTILTKSSIYVLSSIKIGRASCRERVSPYV